MVNTRLQDLDGATHRSVDQQQMPVALAASEQRPTLPVSPLQAPGAASTKARLARSGHCAQVIGHLLLVSGGILRDGGPDFDIMVVDLNTLTYIQPEVFGEVPITRFRHTTVAVIPDTSSRLANFAYDVLQPLQRKLHEGSVVLMYGGYNTMGQEFGVDHFEAFWISHDGRTLVWVPIKALGQPPSARFHHTTNAFDGGRQLVLYGGEGHELIDGSPSQGPAVYLLDVNSLTWRRQETHCSAVEHSPGVRSLHIATIRQSPQTGHEELVVLAGYCQNVLAAMNPYCLDLTTFEWARESGLVRAPKEEDPQELPRPRQRTAAERVGSQWLLLLGGSPTQFLQFQFVYGMLKLHPWRISCVPYGHLVYHEFLQGNFLDDMLKLHLPTLTWRRCPIVHGRPIRPLRRIAGHSMDGMIAFGGCIPTIMGIMPVAKTDPLLIGPEPPLDLFLAQDPSMTQPAFLHQGLYPAGPYALPLAPEEASSLQLSGVANSAHPDIAQQIAQSQETYTAWRVAGPSGEVHTETLRLAPNKGRAFWRNEVTGQFYMQNESGHTKLSVLEPIAGPSSESSDSSGSPGADSYLNEQLHQLNQAAGAHPPQDQGPCLMQ